MNAQTYLDQANIHVAKEILSDGSAVFNLHIGDREFPCYSERHAHEAAARIADALANASNGSPVEPDPIRGYPCSSVVKTPVPKN